MTSNSLQFSSTPAALVKKPIQKQRQKVTTSPELLPQIDPLWNRIRRRKEVSTANLDADSSKHLDAPCSSWKVTQRRLEALMRNLGLDSLEQLSIRWTQAGCSMNEVTELLWQERDELKEEEILREPHLLFSRDDIPQAASTADESLLPFIEILFPIGVRAHLRLEKTLHPGVRKLITNGALEGLRKALLSELCVIAKHALIHELHIFRSTGHFKNTARFAILTGSAETQVYASFVQSIVLDGGVAFYQRYPIVLRLFKIRCEYWLNNTKRLLNAYRKDREDIATTLGAGCHGVITHALCGMSDSHDHGRSVSILTTASGGKIVFKPRCVALEDGFMRIAEHLNESTGQPLYRTFSMVSKPDHGWCEYVPSTPLRDSKEVEDFYHRIGLLLSLLYVLGGTDCHFENLHASDGYPVMIDLETLFHPNYELSSKRDESIAARKVLWDSVTRVGLLPTSRAENELDMSALGAFLSNQTVQARVVEGHGNASMGLKDKVVTISACHSNPEIPQAVMLQHIRMGFSEGYAILQRERDSILELLPSIASATCRFVARPTSIYATLYERSLDATALKSGIDRSIELERLFRAGLKSADGHRWRQMAEVERKALEDLDIPKFSIRLDRRSLSSGGRTVLRNFLKRTPLDTVRARLQSLSDKGRMEQLRILELAWAQRADSSTPAVHRSRCIETIRAHKMDKQKVLGVARDLADRIESTSLNTDSGSPTWLNLTPNQEEGEFKLQPSGLGLYEGNAGVALFLSAIYAIDGEFRYKEAAHRTLKPVLKSLKSVLKENSFDLGNGATGIAYALYRSGHFLNDVQLRRQAFQLMMQTPADWYSNPPLLDVMSGAAGQMLVMELLSREFHPPRLKAKMRDAADFVVASAIKTGSDAVAWRTIDDKLLLGFAHGSAGIAYSLMRVGHRLNDGRYLTAAQQGQHYQALNYDERTQTWPDLRQDAGSSAPCSWCHGVAGIALGHAASASPEGDLSFSRALSGIERKFLQGITLDTACCGIAGALETLTTNESPRAQELRASLVESLCDERDYRFLARSSSNQFLVGLFNGASGVGYQLLRATFPDKIPPLLLLN